MSGHAEDRGWINLSVIGEGPYRISPEGYAFEVETPEDDGGVWSTPEDFVIGCHSREVATAICAFMNWWTRENARTGR